MTIGLWRLTDRWPALVLPSLLGLVLLLLGCEPSGDSDALSTPTTPGPRVEQQAVDNLLQL
jgi:hypothetical protein